MNKVIKLLVPFILILSSCQDPIEANICNSQDPDNHCYMPIPDSRIMSYNPHSIIINDISNELNSIENNSNIKDIIVEKIINDIEIDSVYLIPIEAGTYEFIDNDDIALNSFYSYKLKFQSFDNTFSDISFIEPFLHQYRSVDDISISLVNESEANIIWNYNYSDNFSEYVDSLRFTLIKAQLNNNETDLIDTTFINLTLPLSNNTEYIYSDSFININDILQYSIFMSNENLESDIIISEIDTVNFPQCNINYSVPLNSHTVHLKWECDYVIDKLAEIRLSNQWNEELFIIQNADSSGYYTDNLKNYMELIDVPNDDIANIEVNYTLTWKGEGGGSSYSNRIIKTFPIHHMEYVPALTSNSFHFGTENENFTVIDTITRAFYIDKYEVSNDLYQNPGSNPYQKWDDTPVQINNSGIDFDQANQFCVDRSNAYADIDLEFVLPNELDWEIAASAQYSKNLIYDKNLNKFMSTSIDKLIYSQDVDNGEISCFYANIESCYNEPINIGYFTDSFSPSGIYDFSGNVKEWVKKYFPHPDESVREILRGGDYNSNPSDVKSTSFIYENGSIQHKSIGFRTIIYADTYNETIRGNFESK